MINETRPLTYDWASVIIPGALSAGVCAAVMNEIFYKIHHRPCMKVHFKGDGVYFPCTSDVDKCAAPYRLFFQILISNESPDPIAITEITLCLTGFEEKLFVNDFFLPMDKYDMEPYFQGIEKDKYVTKNDTFRIENPIKCGTVVKPYEAMNGAIFIAGCPEIKCDEVDGVLKISTTRKGYKYDIVARRYSHVEQKYIDL
ncbi:MAG: hypothetical protein E7200_04870 [Selenomonas ruminantium]|nr:hypothetical protein [Selenomonas ruminantium]